MPKFHYRSVTASGETMTGTMDADSQDAVIARLHQLGQTPLSIDRGGQSAVSDLLNKDIVTLRTVKSTEVEAMTRSIATLLNAGIPLDRALEMTLEVSPQAKSRKLLGALLEEVRGGVGFAASLDRHPEVFSEFYRSMVRAGEAGAALETVLSRLADHMERSRKTLASVRSALIYPAFLLTAAVAAVVILLAVVVPTFKPMFEEAGAALPASTAVVIALGTFFQAYWWTVLMGFLAIGIGLFVLNTSPAGRLWWHTRALQFPVFGTIWLKSDVARFSRTLGVLLENGVSLVTALAFARGVIGNAAVAGDIKSAGAAVEAGKGLARPLTDSGVLPPLALQLIRVGEETGNLEPMMQKLADIYDDETKVAFERMMSLLTPVLTLVIGLIIAFIISSILFALFSINELAR